MHADGAEHAGVLRDELLGHHLVEQQRAHDVEAGDLERALERHVTARLYFVGRTGEVYQDGITALPYGNVDLERLAPVASVVVQPALGVVVAIRDSGDFSAQAPLRVVHPVVRRAHHRAEVMPVDELEEPVGSRAHCGDHCFDVGGVGIRGSDAVAQDRPDRVVTPAALVQLDAVVERALGEHVDQVDVQPRSRRADVDQVSGCRGEADQLAAMEDGRNHAHVGRVRGAVVGMVVDDDVAFVDLPGELAHEPADVSRQRPDVHRGGFALAELVAVGVVEPAAQVLRLADDARVGHAIEHLRHLARDRAESAADDA